MTDGDGMGRKRGVSIEVFSQGINREQWIRDRRLWFKNRIDRYKVSRGSPDVQETLASIASDLRFALADYPAHSSTPLTAEELWNEWKEQAVYQYEFEDFRGMLDRVRQHSVPKMDTIQELKGEPMPPWPAFDEAVSNDLATRGQDGTYRVRSLPKLAEAVGPGVLTKELCRLYVRNLKGNPYADGSLKNAVNLSNKDATEKPLKSH